MTNEDYRHTIPDEAREVVFRLYRTEDIAKLPEMRKSFGEGKNIDTDGEFGKLRSGFEEVWAQFRPMAHNVATSRNMKLGHCGYHNRGELEAFADRVLWDVITCHFEWLDYRENLEAAPSSLLKYVCNSMFEGGGLKKSPETIGGVDLSNFINPDSWWGGDPLEILLRREELATIADCINGWGGEATQLQKKALMEVVNGKSVREIAKEEGVAETAIKKRLARAKAGLAKHLIKNDYGAYLEITDTKDCRWRHSTRLELLEERRRRIVRVYGNMKGLLPPMVTKALESFYGLDGGEPTFDYRKTADDCGFSLECARVYVPQGLRIIFGRDSFSERALTTASNEKLYEWHERNGPPLEERQETFLHMYFIEGLKHSEIASKIGVSAATVGRQIAYALKAIQSFRNIAEPIKQIST